jgi:glucose/arabinose dehydrogenase
MSAQRPFARRSGAVVGTLLAAVLVLLSATRSFATELLNALVPATVEVPSSLRTTPFDQDRVLMVPPGFKISVLTRIPAARFIMPSPPARFSSDRSILVVRPQANGMAAVSTLIDDLQNPQGMALHRSEDSLYLYVGESNQVSRFTIPPGAASASNQTVIVPNLPASSSPALHGPYRHELKNLVIGPDNELYVDIASSTNADPVDTTSDPVRSAIYQYDLEGKMGESSPAASATPKGWRLFRGPMSFGQQSTNWMTSSIPSGTVSRAADQSIT